jgi:FkbM family methyltransferase
MGLRNLASHLSRGVVLRRRLPRQFGRLPIYVTPEAALRYWFAMSRVDPVLYGMAEELVHPGARVWDIGANVGLFSFCAASRAGPSGFVLSIEPDPWLAHLIQRSSRGLDGYPSSRVEVLCAAVSDASQILKLEIARGTRASNRLVAASQAADSLAVQPTVALSLDMLLEYFSPPSVVKIDVERHEISVLKGATRVLQEVRPTIWCEVSPENSTEATTIFKAAGYELYGAQTRPHPRAERAWFHTLAIPIESKIHPN